MEMLTLTSLVYTITCYQDLSVTLLGQVYMA